MERNVGSFDRALRVVAGVVLLGLTYLLSSELRWLGLIGLVPLLTGIAGACPAYKLLGINTCQARRGKAA